MNSSTIRLIVVDDHQLVLGGVRAAIERRARDIEIVAAVQNWPAALMSDIQPGDVVLLDVDLKEPHPIGLTMKVATLRSMGAQVILMSSLADPRHVQAAIDAGALTFVDKSENDDLIVESIRAASRGEAFTAVEWMQHPVDDRTIPRLTRQQRAVLALYADGHSLDQVSRLAGLSVETVKSYIKAIRKRYSDTGTHLGDKIALHRAAVEQGLLS